MVAHFFGENVRGIAFATDVGDCDASVFDPLLGRILSMFNMTVSFSGKIMAPFNACIVVIVEWCIGVSVVNRVSK
jgi:hypothetical protein